MRGRRWGSKYIFEKGKCHGLQDIYVTALSNVLLKACLESFARVDFFFVSDEEEKPSRTVWNTCAMQNLTLTMIPHINSITKSCYFQIQNLSRIANISLKNRSKPYYPLFLHGSITWTICCIKPPSCWQKDCRTFKTMQQELWRNRGNPVIVNYKKKQQNSHFLLNIFRPTFSPRRELNDNYKDVLQVNKVYMNEIVFKD